MWLLRKGRVAVIPDEARFLVGLIGSGIGTSLSPQLHEQEAAELGLRYFYQLIDIDRLGAGAPEAGSLLREARRLGFRGLNITHPCKQAVVRYLDDLSPAAAALGAVNTVVFTGGKVTGHNTDSSGFEAAFTRGLPGAGLRHAVVLGAGGAGAAVADVLLRLGARRLTVTDVLLDRAGQLAAVLRGRFAAGRVQAVTPEGLAGPMAEADGLVNATPVGMESQVGLPLPEDLLRPGMWVADIVYRPLDTLLLQRARARGCPTLSGSGMLVFQAADAFRLFTGRAPDVGRMFRHLARLTAGQEQGTGAGAGHAGTGQGEGCHVPVS
jgi:quinate/shikimate dehydrogenase (NAD+)